MNKKVLWFDTETTGLDPRKQDIIQLAYLVEINGEIKEEGNFYCQPFNYDVIDAKAFGINNFSIAKIQEFPTPQETYKKLIIILDKYVNKYDTRDKFSPAGFNVGFDINFLKNFFIKNNDKYYGAYFDYHMLSVESLLYLFDYKGIIKLNNYKLETVCNYFGIEADFHNALDDIRVTRMIFQKLLQYIKS